MVAEILSVGTELLLGQIVNSDAQYLSRRLSELGINVYHHTTVGDNPARVREALRQALGRSDLVITTGGLGPTEDDLTKEMVAQELGLDMRLHEPSMRALEESPPAKMAVAPSAPSASTGSKRSLSPPLPS